MVRDGHGGRGDCLVYCFSVINDSFFFKGEAAASLKSLEKGGGQERVGGMTAGWWDPSDAIVHDVQVPGLYLRTPRSAPRLERHSGVDSALQEWDLGTAQSRLPSLNP